MQENPGKMYYGHIGKKKCLLIDNNIQESSPS